jgi:uncharacterized membrane protein
MTITPTQDGSEVDRAGRGETGAERNDRNLDNLLQELRVAGLGVQVLFGFLLALPFSNRFVRLSTEERGLYQVSLLTAALSTALLITPVAYHRWVFRRHEKGRLLRTANICALAGLASVALAIATAVALVLSFVGTGWVVPVFVPITVMVFVALWFGVPIHDRIVHRDEEGST